MVTKVITALVQMFRILFHLETALDACERKYLRVIDSVEQQLYPDDATEIQLTLIDKTIKMLFISKYMINPKERFDIESLLVLPASIGGLAYIYVGYKYDDSRQLLTIIVEPDGETVTVRATEDFGQSSGNVHIIPGVYVQQERRYYIAA